MTNEKTTTFVLIPGAWHPPSCFDLVAKRLRDAGYKVVSKHHASVGAEPPITDYHLDVAIARRAIEDEVERDQDVIVFMHSYGGVVGTEACRGLAKHDASPPGDDVAPGGGHLLEGPAGKKKGGVVRLIYCAALMLLEGRCLADTLTPPPTPWNTVSEDGTRVDVHPSMHRPIFFQDLTPEHAAQVTRTLAHHSAQTFLGAQGYAAWRDIPSVYVFCTQDRAISVQDQRDMVNAARRAGARAVETVTLEASHSPFLSMPGRVVDVCVKAAEESALRK